MKAVQVTLDCERSSLFLVDMVRDELLLVCTDTDATGIRMPIAAGVAGAVVRCGTTVRIDDPYEDARFDKTADQKTGFRTRNILAAPIRSGKKSSEGNFFQSQVVG